jgi:hypothetical protein
MVKMIINVTKVTKKSEQEEFNRQFRFLCDESKKLKFKLFGLTGTASAICEDYDSYCIQKCFDLELSTSLEEFFNEVKSKCNKEEVEVITHYKDNNLLDEYHCSSLLSDLLSLTSKTFQKDEYSTPIEGELAEYNHAFREFMNLNYYDSASDWDDDWDDSTSSSWSDFLDNYYE